jgi:hypothetical protein
MNADASGFKKKRGFIGSAKTPILYDMPQIAADGSRDIEAATCQPPNDKTNDEAKVAAGRFENKIIDKADLTDGRLHQETTYHQMPLLFPGYNHDTQGTVRASGLNLTPNNNFKVAQECYASQKASLVNRPSVSYVQHGQLQLQQQHKPFTMENEVPACQPNVLNSIDYFQHEEPQLQQHYSAFKNKVPVWQQIERPSYNFNWQIGNNNNGMVPNQAVNSFAPSSSARQISSTDSELNINGIYITMPSAAQASLPNEYAFLHMMRMMQLQQSFPSSSNGHVHNQLQQCVYATDPFSGENGIAPPQNQGEAVQQTIELAPAPFIQDLYESSDDDFNQFLEEFRFEEE